MNFFVDMCIVIFYSDKTSKEYSKVMQIVNKKQEEKIIICYYILDENLPKWIQRQKVILEEVVKKIKDPVYELGNSERAKMTLFPNDITRAKKLLAVYSLSDKKEEFYSLLVKNQIDMFQRINFFLRNVVDKKVVPINSIIFKLKSAIFSIINNHSDAMTLASGIQYHQEEKIILLTADKKDWTKENLEWALPEHSQLRKEYPNLPEIRYIF
ncbi:MAG: hypothetical protein Q8N63_07490 [Nanoarchaeota archaeon]|nr:hypothetical protein [Nanoarchaeota archaeon]